VQQPAGQAERLRAADRLLTKIRLYVRLSFDLHCLSQKQFEQPAHRLDEIGRLLGGWQKNQSPSSGRQSPA
jgi:hypothetical protein